jgi:hypothetical protein
MKKSTSKDYLETFLSQASVETVTEEAGARVKHGRGYKVVEAEPARARNTDLFENIVADLDQPEELATVPEKPSPSGSKAVRHSWDAAYEDVDKSEDNSMLPRLFEAAKLVGSKIVFFILIVALSVVIITGIRYGIKAWSESRERQAQAVQAEQDKMSAFLNAGWRQSERVNKTSTLEGDEDQKIAYLKELGPDNGRVHLQIVTEGYNTSYTVTGWVSSAMLRQQAIEQINSVFPEARASIGHIQLRLSGKLEKEEVRLIAQEERYTPEGKKIDQLLQYGESGYTTLRDKPVLGQTWTKYNNTINGTPPAPGNPYYYVISGGGSYWRTPQQRQKLIDAALRRLREGPDGGKNALGIVLVYYDSGMPLIEEIMISTASTTAPTINSFTAEPATISQGQSTTLHWNTSDATKVTVNGEPASPAGSRTDKPKSATVYKLQVSGPDGNGTEREVTVTVDRNRPKGEEKTQP